MKNEKDWYDCTELKIAEGDILHNPFNEPANVPVLADKEGNLYLGDFETPFDDRYQFHRFWTVKDS